MKHLTILMLMIIISLTFTISTFAQIPRLLSYQGILADSLGNPKPDSSYMITFRLYESSAGGSEIWSEQKTLQMKRGLFSTILGDQDPFSAGVKFDRPYWMSLQVAADPELSPRIPLTAVGYSLNSAKSDTAKFAHSASQQVFVDSARIAGTIPDNTITTAKILDGTIQRADVQSTFKAPYADTSDYSKVTLPGGSAGGDLTGTYPDPTIAANAVTSLKILDGTIQRADVQSTFKAPYADTSDYAKVASTGGAAGGDLTGTYPNPTVANNAITTEKILDGTIQRSDVESSFKAPYSDTSDYAKEAPPGGAAGGDLTGTYPNPTVSNNAITASKIASDAVTTEKILDGTIQRSDVESSFKAPYSDTSDYAKEAPPGGAAGGDLTGNIS